MKMRPLVLTQPTYRQSRARQGFVEPPLSADAPHPLDAHRQRQVFTPMTSMSPLFSLVLLLILLAGSSAGCVIQTAPEILTSMSEYLNRSGILPIFLCLFAVGIVFILLAAGVEIKIAKLSVVIKPSDNRAGRILLAVLGIFMLSLAGLLGFFEFQWRTASLLPPPTSPIYLSKSVSLPFVEGRTSVSGRVSFDNYQDEFKKHYSKLTIQATIVDADGEQIKLNKTVDRHGQFAFDIPVSTRPPMTVAWSADDLGDYVLGPIEIDLPAWQASRRADISFVFEEIDDFFDRHKDEAIEAVRACDVERADAGLTALLAVLERFDSGPGSTAQTWPHDIHRDLANEAAELQSCAQDRSTFERKWRREAIKRATTRTSRVYAMNAWAGYSTQVYRPGGRAWPDLTLLDVDLVQEEYRDLLRKDLHLIMEKLAETSVRALVSNPIHLPAIAGCLSDGQREALQSFESVLSEPERVNLNRMMNVISGLQRVVMPEWLLGTWINYPSKDQGGEIEIVRQRVLDGFEYRMWITPLRNERRIERNLAFTPSEFKLCRFTINDNSMGRPTFEVLDPGQGGPLRRESDGETFLHKDGNAESSSR